MHKSLRPFRMIEKIEVRNNMNVSSRNFAVQLPSTIACLLMLAMLTGASLVCAQSSGPTLLYSSAKAGPNQGWTNSTTQGAAITIWGKNFGTTRGSSYVTVAGVNLTSDSSYAEWGATTNPTTAKGFQRITFWLNSSMPVATSTISVTVGGVTSNTLPFTIDNTAATDIRFVSQANGNDSWDGLYPDHSLGGSHGPWKTPFMYTIRSGTGPGMFLYLLGETFTAIFDSSSGHPATAYIGYFEEGGTNCTVYYPQINGTDALRYTVTSYPGQMAVLQNVGILNKSSYWTIANIKFTGTTSGQGLWILGNGDEWSMCADCQRSSTGLDVIGVEFGGWMHHAINYFGDSSKMVANYVNMNPDGNAGSGFAADTSYIFYINSGDNNLIADNEFHGGGMYSIHNYDEYRCASSNDTNRRMHNNVYDSNLFDLTQNATNPQLMRDGILTGLNINDSSPPVGNKYYNNTVKNNVLYSNDNLVSEGCIKSFSETSTTLNGVHIYGNTCYNVPAGYVVDYSSLPTYTNVDLMDNIFYQLSSAEISMSSMQITTTYQYNLSSVSPRLNGATNGGHNVVGNPGFVNAPSDFHLQSTSPAIGAGLAIAGVTRDFDALLRPTPPSMGAHEFAAGSSNPPNPPTGLAATVN